MRSRSANAETRRARPLLGTFVEIRTDGLPAARLGIERAFAAVERVHALMSPREESSDVSRINRSRLGQAVPVDTWTYKVLAAAQLFSAYSGGVFDVTAVPGDHTAPRVGTWRDLVLLPENRVQRVAGVRVDLGGIAKGFAVDRAVEALRYAGATSGVVNAGGDLRVFGSATERVHVRHPASPGTLVPLADLSEAALASSANYLDNPGAHRLMHPGGGRLWLGRSSVSVRASSCLMADALCKVVATVGPQRARPLLHGCRASAIVLTRQSRAFIEDFAHAA